MATELQIPNNPVPSANAFTEVAAQLMAKIRALQADIAGYTIPRTEQEIRELVQASRVSDEFIEAAAVAISASATLAQQSVLSPEDARATISFRQAFLPVLAQLEATARGLRHTLRVHRARAGNGALRVYEVAKGLRRSPDGGSIVPHIAAMKQALRPRRRTAPTPEQPQQPPKPA